MKKLLSCILVSLSVMSFVSCGSEAITESNFSQIYESSREEIINSEQSTTTAEHSIISTYNDETMDTSYNVTYKQLTEGEKYTAHFVSEFNNNGDILTLEGYNIDGEVYAYSPKTNEKYKFTDENIDFKELYYNVNLVDLSNGGILSTEIAKADKETTTLSLVLDADLYPEVFENDLQSLEYSLGVPASMLKIDLSDIEYIVNFDSNNKIKTVDTVYTIATTISLAELLGQEIEGAEDEVIARETKITLTIDELEKVTIDIPEDLDQYVDYNN